MLVRLALDTRCHHPLADEDRLAALSIATLADYRTFLLSIYGFEGSVERALHRLPQIDDLLARLPSRMDALRRDLLALDANPEARAIIDIPSFAHALGWLFVVERQALLAGLLRRHLLHTLGDQTPCEYLTFDSPGARVRAYGDFASEVATKLRPTTIVTAANEAFRVQHAWYCEAR
jgi:heme oxygenase